MHKTKIGNRTLLQGEFSLDDGTSIRDIFDPMWESQCRHGELEIRQMFVGLDSFRQGFLLTFESDDNFINASEQQKDELFSSMKKIIERTLEREDYYEANGMSFFSLWAAAAATKQLDAKAHIEEKFFELRSRYNL